MKKFLVRVFSSLPLIYWLVLAGCGIFFWILIFGHHGFYEMQKLLSIRHTLGKEKTALVKMQEELTQELKLLDEPAYIKHLIREELGYAAPDEKIILFNKKQEPLNR